MKLKNLTKLSAILFIAIFTSCSDEEIVGETQTNQTSSVLTNTKFKNVNETVLAKNLGVNREKLEINNIDRLRHIGMENGIDIYRIDFKEKYNSYDYMFYSHNTNDNSYLSYLVKENLKSNKSDLYTLNGEYVHSFTMIENELAERYIDEGLSSLAVQTSCYSDCMTTSEANWHSDSNGGVSSAFNDITWNTVGQVVAAVVCGGCCEGWWGCPQPAAQQQQIYIDIDLTPIVPLEDIKLDLEIPGRQDGYPTLSLKVITKNINTRISLN